MTAWQALAAELDDWAADGRALCVWWRDDDAVTETPALRRLFALRRAAGVPLALAVVPAEADARLAASVAAERDVAVLVHGWSHRNHAPAGTKKCEFPAGRPIAAMTDEIAAGRARIAERFAGRALPVFVPPWNRLDPALVPLLAGLGFAGLSTDGARGGAEAAPGLARVNVHLDPKHGPPEAAALRLRDDLARRRCGAGPTDEPIGLMTHHLVHDAPTWDGIARLLDLLAGHPAVRLAAAAALFRPGGRA